MKFEEMKSAGTEKPKLQKIMLPIKQMPKEEHQLAYKEKAPYKVSPESMDLSILQQNLEHCLSIIDDEVMKGYVAELETLPILPMEAEMVKQQQAIHFFRISELVYQENEFSVDNLAMVFHALSNKPCTLVLMVKSDGIKQDFYLGARPLNKKNSSGTMMQMLKQTLLGFFQGSQISEYFDDDMKEDMGNLDVGCISSVTCVADYKKDKGPANNLDFIQGMEKLIYSLQGKRYTAVFIADNLSSGELLAKKREYENIYTQISSFANMQLNFAESGGRSTSLGESEGKSTNFAHGTSQGISTNVNRSTTEMKGTNQSYGTTETSGTNESVSDGKTHTIGHTDGTTDSESDTHTEGKNSSVGVNLGAMQNLMGGLSLGANVGVGVKKLVEAGLSVAANLGAGLGISEGIGFNRGKSSSDAHSTSHGVSQTDSVSDSISKTLTHGSSHSHSDSSTYGISNSLSDSIAHGMGTQIGETYNVGNAYNLMNSETLTDTFGTSQGITLNVENKTLSSILCKLQKQLDRIEECESFGMWDFAAYFLGESAAETETAANTYKAVISGRESCIEQVAVNTWTDEQKVEEIFGYIRNFLHPYFLYNGFNYDGDRIVPVNPTVMVSTNELAIQMGLPVHSVSGLPVVEHAAFAREVLTRKKSEREIRLGKVYHMGTSIDTEVRLDINSLAMHTFVTGSTGAGKSNAVYHLLHEAKKQMIPFLVIEPAKGEYKNIFTDVRCFGTNPNLGEVVRINPFSFPEEIHVLEHIDRIIEIFNVCWPMYAAMPAVLKDSIEQAYVAAGWDLDLSENKKVPGLFPTFDDVLRELNTTIRNSEYSSDTKGDYIGSLSTRIKSLTNGINGRIFVSNEMDLSDLFDRNAILDISRIGSMETKALIMGLVILKLQEYRMANTKGMNLPLKHLTVLEEAHNLLRKTSEDQSQDSANLQGKSVEMLTNAIAEIRTYGEGFIIVDQAPNLLDTAAIRNTNTKIVLRLPEGTDRMITGAAMALKDPQIQELSKLPTGIAAVYQNDWQEAALCSLPLHTMEETEACAGVSAALKQRRRELEDSVLHLLFQRNLDLETLDELKCKVLRTNVSAKIRKDIIQNLETRNSVYEWAVADFIKKNYSLAELYNGTENEKWKTLEQLNEIMVANLKPEFEGFSDEEMLKVMYYVCRIQHELYPQYHEIERLRVDYLKERIC